MRSPDYKRTITIELLINGWDVFPGILGKEAFVIYKPEKGLFLVRPVLVFLSKEGLRAQTAGCSDVSKCDFILAYYPMENRLWLIPTQLIPPSGMITLGKRFAEYELFLHEPAREGRPKEPTKEKENILSIAERIQKEKEKEKEKEKDLQQENPTR